MIKVHGVLEVFFLTLLWIDIFLKWVWLGHHHIIRRRYVFIVRVQDQSILPPQLLLYI